jgi:hypothetical protein
MENAAVAAVAASFVVVVVAAAPSLEPAVHDVMQQLLVLTESD